MAQKVDTSHHFLGKSELAQRYNVCLYTFRRWCKKIEKQIPMYVQGQRLFSPSQIKKIDELLCYSPDYQMEIDFNENSQANA